MEKNLNTLCEVRTGTRHRSLIRDTVGTTSAQHIVMMLCIALVGIAGFRALGAGMGRGISDGGASSAAETSGRGGMAVSSQAGLEEASRIAVVGGTGTIGAAVVDVASLAKEGHTVLGIARKAPPSWLADIFARDNVSHVALDAFGAGDAAHRARVELLKNVDQVVLAAEPYPMVQGEVPEALLSVMRFYKSALEAGFDRGDKRIIRIGSPPAETGRFTDLHRGAELRRNYAWEELTPTEAVLAERHPYFGTKAGIRDLTSRYAEQGLQVVTALPTTVLSWHNHLPPDLDGHILAGTDPMMALTPGYPLDHVAADDVARGILLLGQKGDVGQAYHLGGEARSLGDVTLDVLRQAGSPYKPSLWDFSSDPVRAERELLDQRAGRGLRGMMMSWGRLGIGLMMGNEGSQKYEFALDMIRAMGVRDSSRAAALGYAPRTAIEEAIAKRAAFLRDQVFNRR